MTTCIVADRATAIRVGYDATDWVNPISFEDYCNAVKDWNIDALVRDDECIGAVFTKDGELHVSILPEWRGKWVTRGILRQLFGQDRVTTKVTPGHDHMYGILARLGFRLSDDGVLVKEH